MENITPKQEQNTNMIGGKIREISGKSLADKNYLYLFDEGIKNTIEAYLKTKPNLEPIQLTPQDNLALAERWQQEIKQPSEMSKGMTINQIAEKEANYHSLYNHGIKQTQNLQSMETLTPREKVQELFNEIKETFSPIEKAYFQRKLADTDNIIIGRKELIKFLNYSNISEEEQKKVNSFIAEKISLVLEKQNSNIDWELFKKTETDDDFRKEVRLILFFLMSLQKNITNLKKNLMS